MKLSQSTVPLAAHPAVDLRRTPAGPLVLWHLLSLDAPTVAALWTWFAARSADVPQTPAVPFAMFLAVWLLYAGDRLLDTREGRINHPLQPRHLFHQRHRRPFTAGMVAVGLTLMAVLPAIPAPLLHVYLAFAGLLAVWFGILHLPSRRGRSALPKEIVPGIFFAAAAFLPVAQAHAPGALAALLFAALCTLNCLCIFAWEHGPDARAHGTTRLGVRWMRPLGWVLGVAAMAAIRWGDGREAFPFLAISASSALLLWLDTGAARLDADSLRAAADLVLLTPLLLLPFLR